MGDREINHMTNSNVVSRRGFLKLVSTAGLGVVAANICPGIAWAQGEGLSRVGVKARLFIGSDLHIQNSGGSNASPDTVGSEGRDADKKLLFAFDVAYGIDANLDALCLVGDVTDNGRIDQYHRLMSLIADDRNVGYAHGSGHTKIILCQGNHETYDPGVSAAPQRFLEQTGQQPNKVVDVNGVKVITMGPNTQNDHYYVDNLDFFKETVEDNVGASTDPFLVLSHHQVRGTTYTSYEWYGTYGDEFLEEMRAHPNMVLVSGHSHATLEDERSIGQDFGFTAIQDSTIGAYYENETGKVDPTTGEGASVPPQTSDAYVSGKRVPEASQALVVDVMDDGTVKVYRISLVRTKAEGEGVAYLYEPWAIDVPGMVAAGGDPQSAPYAYTSARVSTAAPTFGAGSLTVDDVKATSSLAHFPTAIPGSDNNLDMVHEYKLVATPTDGGTTVTKRVFHDYYRPSSQVRTNWEVLFKGLAPRTTYTMSVVAQTSWNKEAGAEGAGSYSGSTTAENSTSSPLVSAPFTTLQQQKPSAILDIDYRVGSTTDAMGHTPNRNAGPRLVADTELGAEAFESDGITGWGYQLEDEDYDFFVDSSTTECFFKLTNNQDDQCLFSNQQGAGAGFEVENGNIEFWYNSESGRVIPKAAVRVGSWVHAMAVADGTNVTLYVDGEQVDQQAATTMTVPTPRRYFVGADSSSSNLPEYVCDAGTRIALARLYPRAFSADEVALAYEAAFTVPAVPEKVLDIDFRTGSAEDAVGHELTQSGGELVDDDTLVVGASTTVFEADGVGGFAYQLDEHDYAFFAGHSTTECYYWLPQDADISSNGDHCLFSNQESAGSGLEISGSKLQFWFRDAAADSYVSVETDATSGAWVHVVATFDGVNLALFVNGQQVDATTTTGTMKIPSPKRYYVGCDTNGSGEPQFAAFEGTRIALARLYTKALSAQEVADLYEAVIAAPAEEWVTITYAWEGGVAPQSVELPSTAQAERGSDLILPASPAVGEAVDDERDGTQGTWTFAGWSVEDGVTVDTDLLVTGSWSFVAAEVSGQDNGDSNTDDANSVQGDADTDESDSTGTDDAQEGGDGEAVLPQTGDASPALDVSALGLAGAGLLVAGAHVIHAEAASVGADEEGERLDSEL